ncbi:hypothetical protein SAMN03080615_02425 [Amphritea atlantica]|uniref:Uncharacterized protein n=1 Tax=Amphritea atlantica TaxID=355243 RepID=A0A1H9I4J3_9GAMM|nr:hypothetical protein [Amphritea atlantica]SEQ69457.1 hypothetical protein SAMN03080615_02425 [Amphritea atlantica]
MIIYQWNTEPSVMIALIEFILSVLAFMFVLFIYVRFLWSWKSKNIVASRAASFILVINAFGFFPVNFYYQIKAEFFAWEEYQRENYHELIGKLSGLKDDSTGLWVFYNSDKKMFFTRYYDFCFDFSSSDVGGSIDEESEYYIRYVSFSNAGEEGKKCAVYAEKTIE